MRASDADAGEFQKHMSGTYFSLRMGMGLLAVALPLLLWLGGWLYDREPLRCSMSAYYHSQAMRDLFVGSLVAIGMFLYLYKGFSRQENWALNLGGALAIGIAMVPTGPLCGEAAGPFTLHGTFAVLFFLSIAYVCIFRASDTLSLIRDAGKAATFRTAYRVFGALMVVSPVIAAALAFALQGGRRGSSLVFYVEALAVFTFAAYWLTKSAELSATDAERLALERKLQPISHAKPAVKSGPGIMLQIAPEETDDIRPPGVSNHQDDKHLK